MTQKSSIAIPAIKDTKEENSSTQINTILTNKIMNPENDLKKGNINTNESTSINNSNQNEKEKDNDSKSILKKIEDERIKIDEGINEEQKKIIFMDPTKEKMQFLVEKAKMRTHYYKNSCEEIFSYRYKSITFKQPFLFHCSKKKVKCSGRIRFYNNFSIIMMEGFHEHSDGNDKIRFYRKFPFLAKETWKHIQIFELMDKIIVVRLG